LNPKIQHGSRKEGKRERKRREEMAKQVAEKKGPD